VYGVFSPRLGFILESVPTTYAKAFARAADVLGGVAALSDYLQVPQYELMRWIRGESTPSQRAFMDVVDLLSEANPRAFAAQKLRP
jgi:hypothetical protein